MGVFHEDLVGIQPAPALVLRDGRLHDPDGARGIGADLTVDRFAPPPDATEADDLAPEPQAPTAPPRRDPDIG